MKHVGILGGVGPDTTAKIYLSLTEMSRAAGLTHYPEISIYSMPFPFSVEQDAIVHAKSDEKMIPYLIEGAKVLERAGASFGVLPCNTLHKYISHIRGAVSIPFVSVLDEVATTLHREKVSTIGILATQSTVTSGLYEAQLRKKGIAYKYPAADDQEIINKAIVAYLSGQLGDSHRVDVIDVCQRLQADGVDALLLACTDLQNFVAIKKDEDRIFDSTEILTQAIFRELVT